MGAQDVETDASLIERVAAGQAPHEEVVAWIRDRTRTGGDDASEYLGPLGRSMGVLEAGLNYTSCAVGAGSIGPGASGRAVVP